MMDWTILGYVVAACLAPAVVAAYYIRELRRLKRVREELEKWERLMEREGR